MQPDRPFAARARELCSESAEHHDRVEVCETCRLLEQRLTPITEVLADVLKDANLTITVENPARRRGPNLADPYLTTEPWPFPGQSREERAQHIARTYRDLIFQIAQGRVADPAGALHRLDMQWRRWGIHWHLATEAPEPDPHQWVNARDAAHYTDRAEATIRTWAHRGHITTRAGRDGSTQYLLGSLIDYTRKQRERRADQQKGR